MHFASITALTTINLQWWILPVFETVLQDVAETWDQVVVSSLQDHQAHRDEMGPSSLPLVPHWTFQCDLYNAFVAQFRQQTCSFAIVVLLLQQISQTIFGDKYGDGVTKTVTRKFYSICSLRVSIQFSITRLWHR